MEIIKNILLNYDITAILVEGDDIIAKPSKTKKEELEYCNFQTNKLYWNLHNRLNITSNNCNIVKKNKLGKIKRSFINKSINYNQKNSKYYIISNYISNITEKENNLLYSLLNEKLYKKIMNNPLSKIKIDFSFYYPNDYPFPNVNRCFYNKNKKDYWIKKIFLMYYSNNDKYWYSFIYP